MRNDRGRQNVAGHSHFQVMQRPIRSTIRHMRRGVAMFVAIGLALSAAPLRAQVGGSTRGPMRPGVIIGRPFGRAVNHGFPRQPVVAPFFVPDFYYPYSYVEPAAAPVAPTPTVIVLDQREHEPQPAVSAAAARPTVIEIAAEEINSASPPAKKLPRVFVMKNGERIEAKRYTLTDTQVIVVTAPGEVRRIPLSQLDLDATVAGNRAKGVEIQVPSGPGEYFVSF